MNLRYFFYAIKYSYDTTKEDYSLNSHYDYAHNLYVYIISSADGEAIPPVFS